MDSDAEDTRDVILRAARGRFALYPFPDVTIRAIAREAGVSPSLVVKYFGTKDELLRAVVDFDDLFAHLLDEPDDRLGEELVSRLLAHTSADDAVDPFLMFVLVAVGRDAPEWVGAELLADFVQVLADRLRGDDAQLRAELICGHLIGMSAMRRILAAPSMTAAESADLVARLGPTIQALVDGGSGQSG